jgi:hypothetical protein
MGCRTRPGAAAPSLVQAVGWADRRRQRENAAVGREATPIRMYQGLFSTRQGLLERSCRALDPDWQRGPLRGRVRGGIREDQFRPKCNRMRAGEDGEAFLIEFSKF